MFKNLFFLELESEMRKEARENIGIKDGRRKKSSKTTKSGESSNSRDYYTKSTSSSSSSERLSSSLDSASRPSSPPTPSNASLEASGIILSLIEQSPTDSYLRNQRAIAKRLSIISSQTEPCESDEEIKKKSKIEGERNLEQQQ